MRLTKQAALLSSSGQHIVQFCMSQLSHEFEKFLLHDPEKSLSTVHVHVAQATPLETRTFGRLFLLTEIGTPSKMSQELIGVIQDEMQRSYYQGSQLRLELAFEQALQHVNEQLKHLIESGVTDWLDHFDIIIGVLKDQMLLLTHIGNVRATLIHRGRIIDIIDSAGPEDRKLNPLKIFSNIIAGEIQEEDYLAIFTPNLLDYLSLEKLKRIILDRPPLDAVRHLEELLQEAEPRTPLAALIIHANATQDSDPIVTTHAQPAPSIAIGRTQSSMDGLIERERATQQLLTPSLWLVTRRFVSAIARSIGPLLPSGKSSGPRSRLPAPRMYPGSSDGKTPTLSAISQQGIRTLTTASTHSGRIIGQTIRHAYGRRSRFFAVLRGIPSSIGSLIAGLVSAFPRWSFRKKVLFLAIIALLFFFAQSIVMLGRKNDEQKTTTARAATISSIEEKTFQANAALSYGDETRAAQLTSEAADLLATLAPDKHPDDTALTALNDLVQALRQKTQHLVRIDQPTVVTTLDPQAGPNGLTAISFLRSTLYLTGGQDNALLAVDPETGETSSIENSLAGIEDFRFAVQLNNQSVLAFDGTSGFAQFAPATDELETVDFTPANVDAAITDLATYQNRAYLLDTKNSQIFRFQLGANGFGQASAWIQDAERDLSSVVSMAVDGSIYTLAQDGSIAKFTQGHQVDFPAPSIDPDLTSGTKLWTDAGAANLYILDRASRRLIVLTKSGRLQAQFTSDSFADLKGMAIDESSGRAYLLNGNTVYAVDLNAET